MSPVQIIWDLVKSHYDQIKRRYLVNLQYLHLVSREFKLHLLANVAQQHGDQRTRWMQPTKCRNVNKNSDLKAWWDSWFRDHFRSYSLNQSWLGRCSMTSPIEKHSLHWLNNIDSTHLDQVPHISQLIRLDIRQQTVANVLGLRWWGGGVSCSVAHALTPGGQATSSGALWYRGDCLVVPVDVVLVLWLADALTCWNKFRNLIWKRPP